MVGSEEGRPQGNDHWDCVFVLPDYFLKVVNDLVFRQSLLAFDHSFGVVIGDFLEFFGLNFLKGQLAPVFGQNLELLNGPPHG